MELNKVLEQDGFERVRFRASTRQLTGDEVASASFYRYGARRWLNPDDADDMEAIGKISQKMKRLAGEQWICTPESLAEMLRKAIGFEIALKKMRKNRSAPALLAKIEPKREPLSAGEGHTSASSACRNSETHEASKQSSPTSSHLSIHESQVQSIDDDDELRMKLAKERFSAENLSPVQAAQHPEAELPLEPSPSCASLLAKPELSSFTFDAVPLQPLSDPAFRIGSVLRRTSSTFSSIHSVVQASDIQASSHFRSSLPVMRRTSMAFSDSEIMDFISDQPSKDLELSIGDDDVSAMNLCSQRLTSNFGANEPAKSCW